MGIQNANQFLSSYIQEFTSDMIQPVHICIDGSIFLYQVAHKVKTCDIKTIVHNIMYIIRHHISKIAVDYPIDIVKTTLFLDGVYRPIQKVKRPMNNFEKKEDIKNGIIAYSFYPVHVSYGETDVEWFRYKDPNVQTIFISKDSDLFHLGYSQSKTLMYNIQAQRRGLYDLSQLNVGLSRVAFTLLMIIVGCDYFPTIFTTSMVSAFLNEPKSANYPIDEEISEYHIEKTIFLFYKAIKHCKFSMSRPKETNFNNFVNYTKLLKNVLCYYYFYNSRYLDNFIEIGNGYKYLDYINKQYF